MYPSLCAILEPPAPIGARRARLHMVSPDCEAIPVITGRARTLRVRTALPGDAPLLANLLARLSDRSMQLRFFRPLKSSEQLWSEAVRVAAGDPRRQAALVATVEEDGAEAIVAVAELVHEQATPTTAEFAVVVRDDFQHEGVGKMLSQLLVQIAVLRGVTTLRATMLAENQRIRKLLRGLGVPYTAETRSGEMTALLRLSRS